MSKTCPKCGGTEFRASQACRGTVTVIVTLEPSAAVFRRNDTEDGELDASGLDFDAPEGPFACVSCGAVLDDTDQAVGQAR